MRNLFHSSRMNWKWIGILERLRTFEGSETSATMWIIIENTSGRTNIFLTKKYHKKMLSSFFPRRKYKYPFFLQDLQYLLCIFIFKESQLSKTLLLWIEHFASYLQIFRLLKQFVFCNLSNLTRAKSLLLRLYN